MKILLYVILLLCIKRTISAPRDQAIKRCEEHIIYDFRESPFENFVRAYTEYTMSSLIHVNFFSLEYYKDMLMKVELLENERWEDLLTPRQHCEQKFDEELQELCIDSINAIGGSADMHPRAAFNHMYLNTTKYEFRVDLLYHNQYPSLIQGKETCTSMEDKIRVQIRLEYKTLMIRGYYEYIQEQVTNKCNRTKFISPLQFCHEFIPGPSD